MSNNNQNQNKQTEVPKKGSTALVAAIVIVVIILLAVLVGFEKRNSSSISGMSSSTMPDMADMSTSTGMIAGMSDAAVPTATSSIPSSISNGTTTITIPLTQVPYIYVVSTDKKTYTQNETVNIVISVINNTSASSTFKFPNGCEGDYTIAGFDLAKHITCIQTPSSFTVAPHDEADVPLAHYPSVAILPVGTWPLYASIPGYGGATTTITITQ